MTSQSSPMGPKTVYWIAGEGGSDFPLFLRQAGFEVVLVPQVQAVAEAATERPSCLGMEIGTTLVSELHLPPVGQCPPAVLVATSPSTQLVVEAMRRGASSVLSTPVSGDQLAQACHAAIQDDRRNREFVHRYSTVQRSLERLTDRQCVVLEKAIDGLPNKAIASDLDVSQRTIESERSAITKAFSAESMLEVANQVGQYRVIASYCRIDRHHTSSGPVSLNHLRRSIND